MIVVTKKHLMGIIIDIKIGADDVNGIVCFISLWQV